MTTTRPDPAEGIALDQQLALRSAAARLAEEFSGVFGAETLA